MPIEIFRQFETSDGKGLTLQEYAGSYWLIAGRKLPDGRVVHSWGFPSTKDKKPSTKNFPWKIRLGDSPEEAFRALEFFARQIKGAKK